MISRALSHSVELASALGHTSSDARYSETVRRDDHIAASRKSGERNDRGNTEFEEGAGACGLLSF